MWRILPLNRSIQFSDLAIIAHLYLSSELLEDEICYRITQNTKVQPMTSFKLHRGWLGDGDDQDDE